MEWTQQSHQGFANLGQLARLVCPGLTKVSGMAREVYKYSKIHSNVSLLEVICSKQNK